MMRSRHTLVILAVAALALGLLPACGNNEPEIASPPEEYTKYLVQQAIERYDTDGRDTAFEYLSSPESVNGSWYVFVLEGDYSVVNPNRPDLVGTSTAARTDVNGKPYGKELVAADENGIWVDYFFTNPRTGTPTLKHAWAVRHDGLVFGSGWYE